MVNKIRYSINANFILLHQSIHKKWQTRHKLREVKLKDLGVGYNYTLKPRLSYLK